MALSLTFKYLLISAHDRWKQRNAFRHANSRTPLANSRVAHKNFPLPHPHHYFSVRSESVANRCGSKRHELHQAGELARTKVKSLAALGNFSARPSHHAQLVARRRRPVMVPSGGQPGHARPLALEVIVGLDGLLQVVARHHHASVENDAAVAEPRLPQPFYAAHATGLRVVTVDFVR